MKYGSVCSGIEAATMAWHSLGWKPQWFSEIEPFPSAVLQHHYPETPNLGDMTLIHSNPIFNETTIDVLVGGTPCQSFSVAGLRKGMEDPRGNLALEFCRIADKAKPQWIVWENVPGVLSSNGGKDFGSLLGALGELGYGFAYRVLDAQHFGVAQRRRRVFLIGYLGDWRPAAAVLFESESLCRDIAESRSKREKVTRSIEGSSTPYRKSSRATTKDGLETWVEDQVSNTLNCFDVGDVRSTVSVVENGSWWDGGQTAASLTTRCHDQYMPDKGHFSAVIQKDVYENHPNDSRVKEMGETSSTVTSRWGTGGGNTPIVSETELLSSSEPIINTSPTITTSKGSRGGCSMEAIDEIKAVFYNDKKNETKWLPPNESETIGTLRARDYKGIGNDDLTEGRGLVILDRASFNQGENAQYDAKIEESETIPTLVARGPHAVFPVAVDMYNMSINEQTSQTLSSSASDINHTGGTIQNARVRRLTPVECERLQGFPDNFTNIPYRKKEESPDGPRYKALGNSMAVPVMAWIGKRIQEVSELINEQNNVNKK
jgi:DNA (cytosine-5)-methyltransferase 1